MPYKDPERKRQWEQEHREERNARRRIPRLDTGSGQLNVPQATADLMTALRKRMPDPASGQQTQAIWMALLGLAVAIGVVLVALFAGVSSFNANHFGTRGSGDS